LISLTHSAIAIGLLDVPLGHLSLAFRMRILCLKGSLRAVFFVIFSELATSRGAQRLFCPFAHRSDKNVTAI